LICSTLSNFEIGYVFIPQWITNPGPQHEIFVGVKVGRLEEIPPEVEILNIPARTYATVLSKGDKEHCA
jgi:hypothetical protein